MILECKEEEVDLIIKEAINEADNNAEKVDKLGFLTNNKSYNIHKGFIPLKTRIKYSNFNMEDYSMESTDFIYEFAHFVRKHNISNTKSLVYNLEYFVNSYFGYPGKMNRETIFNDIAWKTTTTDEEYFKALENNKIGDLKGKGAAECTERGALVQQVLSVFGADIYYCMGCVDLESRQEGHCFNIIKRKNDYALLDYSIPVGSYNQEGQLQAFYPFVGILTNEEFLDFINNGTIKSFDDYYMRGRQPEATGTERMYIVGEYEINKENESGKSL